MTSRVMGALVAREQSIQGDGVLFRVKFANCTMQEFIWRIGSTLDHPLMDRTGLKAGYDFTLESVLRPPDGSLLPGHKASSATETAPIIMPALQQELGLKVVSAPSAS